MANVTIVRVGNGRFEIFIDGIKSHLEIVNGSNGTSGHGMNIYGIYNTVSGKCWWRTTLQSCKRAVAFSVANGSLKAEAK